MGVEFKNTKVLSEYALLSDKYSNLVYENYRLNGEIKLEITAANPSTKTELIIWGAKNNIENARIIIPRTGGLERFETFTADVAMPIGQYDLNLSAKGQLSLLSFGFYK